MIFDTQSLSKKDALLAIEKDPDLIGKIKDDEITFDMLMTAVKKNGMAISYLNPHTVTFIQKNELYIEAIKNNPFAIYAIDKPRFSLLLEAVKRNPLTLFLSVKTSKSLYTNYEQEMFFEEAISSLDVNSSYYFLLQLCKTPYCHDFFYENHPHFLDTLPINTDPLPKDESRNQRYLSLCIEFLEDAISKEKDCELIKQLIKKEILNFQQQ